MALRGEPHDFHSEYLVNSKIFDYEACLSGTMTVKDWTQTDLIASYKKDAEFWAGGLWRNRFTTFSLYPTASTQTLKSAKLNLSKALPKIPTNLGDPVFDTWRSFLEECIQAIDDEMQDRGIEQSPSELVRDEIRKTVAAITSLERDCEEEISKNPGQADLIRKIYRQAIDRIREQI